MFLHFFSPEIVLKFTLFSLELKIIRFRLLVYCVFVFFFSSTALSRIRLVSKSCDPSYKPVISTIYYSVHYSVKWLSFYSCRVSGAFFAFILVIYTVSRDRLKVVTPSPRTHRAQYVKLTRIILIQRICIIISIGILGTTCRVLSQDKP